MADEQADSNVEEAYVPLQVEVPPRLLGDGELEIGDTLLN